MAQLNYSAQTASAQTTLTQLFGFNVTETAGASAELQILDGGSGGAIAFDVKLAAGQSVGDMWEHPVAGTSHTSAGWYWKAASGSIRGALIGR